tara:strand:+ start:12920 stop:13330 length:411 start_codon:yes stop_codon:yes gene_type:complete
MNYVIEQIKKHEGFRSKVYKCTQGYDTIGYGFAVKDLVLDKDIAEQILTRKVYDLVCKIQDKFKWFDKLPQEAADVVVNMCYQIGLSGFSKFKKTIALLKKHKFKAASVEMLDSRWALQTPNRAEELSHILRNLSE